MENGVYYLKGVEVRLFADSDYDDLVKCEAPREDEFEKSFKEDTRNSKTIDKDDYFYLPAELKHF